MPEQRWEREVRGDVRRDLAQATTGEVRQLVRDLLDGHNALVIDDAVLVTDELVTNALRHGGWPRSCRLALTNRGRTLRVEVDDSVPTPPRFREPDSTGGRGLVLIDELSAAWASDGGPVARPCGPNWR